MDVHQVIQGYMVLSPQEQAKVCERMALTKTRNSGFTEEADVPGMLEGMAALIL